MLKQDVVYVWFIYNNKIKYNNTINKNNKLSYNWFVNGRPTYNPKDSSITFRSESGVSGITNIELAVSNTLKRFQNSSVNFNIIF
jgi:hypothetical protein